MFTPAVSATAHTCRAVCFSSDVTFIPDCGIPSCMADILFADAEPTGETCVETLRLSDGTVILGTDPLRPSTVTDHNDLSPGATATVEARTVERLDGK